MHILHRSSFCRFYSPFLVITEIFKGDDIWIAFLCLMKVSFSGKIKSAGVRLQILGFKAFCPRLDAVCAKQRGMVFGALPLSNFCAARLLTDSLSLTSVTTR